MSCYLGEYQALGTGAKNCTYLLLIRARDKTVNQSPPTMVNDTDLISYGTTFVLI